MMADKLARGIRMSLALTTLSNLFRSLSKAGTADFSALLSDWIVQLTIL